MFKIASLSEAPPQDHAGGAYDTPPNPSSIGASCLRQSQLRAEDACNFSDSHVYMRKTLKFTCTPAQSPPPQHLQHLDFSTSNMSHYLKSLKICPVFPSPSTH